MALIAGGVTFVRPILDQQALDANPEPAVVRQVTDVSKKNKTNLDRAIKDMSLSTDANHIAALLDYKSVWPHVVSDAAMAVLSAEPRSGELSTDEEVVLGIDPLERRLISIRSQGRACRAADVQDNRCQQQIRLTTTAASVRRGCRCGCVTASHPSVDVKVFLSCQESRHGRHQHQKKRSRKAAIPPPRPLAILPPMGVQRRTPGGGGDQAAARQVVEAVPAVVRPVVAVAAAVVRPVVAVEAIVVVHPVVAEVGVLLPAAVRRGSGPRPIKAAHRLRHRISRSVQSRM